jgi:hypothetical protein
LICPNASGYNNKSYTEHRDGYVIAVFQNPQWVWFSTHKGVVTLLRFGINGFGG